VSSRYIDHLSGRADPRGLPGRGAAEAWGWLVQQNFLCPDPTESQSNGWLFISRRGKTIQSTDDFKKYGHISLLPRNVLDPELNKKVWPSFIDGDFDTAIFAAFKEVEVRMRTAAGLDTSHIGVNLARKVFNKVFNPENGQLTEKLNPDKVRKVHIWNCLLAPLVYLRTLVVTVLLIMTIL
jgi:hypothetical protein